MKSKSQCSGCHACYAVCPRQSIAMIPDQEGFLYPKVDTQACVHCGLCVSGCPVLHKTPAENRTSAYAVMHRSEEIRNASSSGGVFTALAKMILDRGGVVFGAAFSDDFHSVEHRFVDSEEELCLLRGSKYLQSTIGNAYQEARSFLENGREVLFTGTPCQIAGLKAYLRKEYSSLYTADVVCHGVPSPKVWDWYLKSKEEENGAAATGVTFRSKQTGWHNYSVEIHFGNGKKYTSERSKDWYMKGFLRDLYLRPSCYDCSFKGKTHEADITLGDFWGVDTVVPSMNDNKGTSLIFVHTQKGAGLLSWAADTLQLAEVDTDSAIRYNSAMIRSVPAHPKRQAFFGKLTEENILKRIVRYTQGSKWAAVKSRIKRCCKRLLKNN